MNGLRKKIISVISSFFIIAVVVYGSYLPLRKSQLYISALREVRNLDHGTAMSIDQFKQILSPPLEAISPIGQEEVVRKTGSFILGLIRLKGTNHPEISTAATAFVLSYYEPMIARHRGINCQDFYILGTLNELAFIQTQNPEYLLNAKKYYRRGLELSPTRPQFLYGMFDVSRLENNIEATKVFANQIISQWPDDEVTRRELAGFLGAK